MASTSVKYTISKPTGVTYAIPFPFLEPDHVKVYLNGAGFFNYNLLQETSSIDPTVPLPVGGVLTVRRETPLGYTPVAFEDVSTLTARDLDLVSRYSAYISQEAKDAAEAALMETTAGVLDARGLRLVQVTAGRDAGDAVNRGQLDSAVAQLSAGAAEASTSAGVATAAASQAQADAVSSAASEAAAQSYSDAAMGYRNDAARSASDAQYAVQNALPKDLSGLPVAGSGELLEDDFTVLRKFASTVKTSLRSVFNLLLGRDNSWTGKQEFAGYVAHGDGEPYTTTKTITATLPTTPGWPVTVETGIGADRVIRLSAICIQDGNLRVPPSMALGASKHLYYVYHEGTTVVAASDELGTLVAGRVLIVTLTYIP